MFSISIEVFVISVSFQKYFFEKSVFCYKRFGMRSSIDVLIYFEWYLEMLAS